MTLHEIIRDYGYIASIVLVPIGIYVHTKWSQDRKTRRQSQHDLFLRLMTYRKTSVDPREWINALNQIDVVFQDSSRIRQLWRDYFDSLHPKSQHFENRNSFMLDLLSEMANYLGYKSIKQTEIDRFYSPVLFNNSYALTDLTQTENLRVLLHSKALGSPY